MENLVWGEGGGGEGGTERNKIQTKLLNIDVKGVWNRSETAWHQSVVSGPRFQIASASEVFFRKSVLGLSLSIGLMFRKKSGTLSLFKVEHRFKFGTEIVWFREKVRNFVTALGQAWFKFGTEIVLSGESQEFCHCHCFMSSIAIGLIKFGTETGLERKSGTLSPKSMWEPCGKACISHHSGTPMKTKRWTCSLCTPCLVGGKNTPANSVLVVLFF